MKGKRQRSRETANWVSALCFMFPHNLEKRTHYGCLWHERRLIEKIQDKLSRATSPTRRDRLVQRMKNAQARLMALKLAEK